MTKKLVSVFSKYKTGDNVRRAVRQDADSAIDSFASLLEYTLKEHTSDHKDGYCQDAANVCPTCIMLAQAKSNLARINLAVKKMPSDNVETPASVFHHQMTSFGYNIFAILTGKD